jgi:polysaccharide biosynthesis protein PslF
MRIGLVTGEYPPMEGGVGAFTRELARAMAAQDHKMFVFTRQQAQAGSDDVMLSSKVGKRWGWQTLREIADWDRSNQLDVINIQFQTAAYDMHPAVHWLPACISRTPTLVTFHDLRAPYLFPKAGPIRDRVVRKMARDATGVIATDRADVRRLRENWSIRNVDWIPIGSNISTTLPVGYDRQSWREKMSVGPSDLLISYFGFLNESKGALILIDAMARLVSKGIPARLVMIGGRAGASDPTNRDYGSKVDALIGECGLSDRVIWTGFVEDKDVTAYFRASDITALPYRDGVSLRRGTLMAALAHGRAIVTTTAETDIPELDAALITVSPDEPQALADAILAVWQNSQLRESLEAAALATSQHFTWESIAHRTINIYQSVLT